jgi:hypothetical protein
VVAARRTQEDMIDARCRLMLDVARDILAEDSELRLCEGLRLIEATRQAVARTDAASLDHFDTNVRPLLRRVLLERFGVADEANARIN